VFLSVQVTLRLQIRPHVFRQAQRIARRRLRPDRRLTRLRLCRSTLHACRASSSTHHPSVSPFARPRGASSRRIASRRIVRFHRSNRPSSSSSSSPRASRTVYRARRDLQPLGAHPRARERAVRARARQRRPSAKRAFRAKHVDVDALMRHAARVVSSFRRVSRRARVASSSRRRRVDARRGRARVGTTHRGNNAPSSSTSRVVARDAMAARAADASASDECVVGIPPRARARARIARETRGAARRRVGARRADATTARGARRGAIATRSRISIDKVW